MKIKFWGTRGSIASPGWGTARFGGNTACVEVRAPDGTLIVLDCGTGSRELGLHLMRTVTSPLRINLFIGHTHWDHIQGFPFFAPAFVPGVELNIFAPLGFQRGLGDAMAGQMESSYFPVRLKDLRSRIHFTELDEGFFRVGDVLVETQYLNHTAPTIAYRMTVGDATLAYVTDHEPFWATENGQFQHPGDQRHMEFLRGADFVIHDAQYTEEEYRQKIGWGHSPINYVTDIAMAAGVSRLALFHHDPTHDDVTMERIEAEARARVATRGGGLDVFAAREGVEMVVEGRGQVKSVAAAASSAIRRTPIIGCRIALIDSDPEEIVAIERELTDDSLVLFSMRDGQSAVERVAEIAPDVVIVSRRLPDADGAELVSQLRALMRRPQLPVVLLIDGDETSDGLEGRDAERTDFLARPFSPPMLRARVRAWLARTLTVNGHRAPDPEFNERALLLRGETTPPGSYLHTLQALPLFRSLTRAQIDALARGSIDQIYPPGHMVVREGAPPDSLFVVLSGRVRVTETSRDTHAELVLSELGPGEVFGELGVLRNQPRVASVVAVDRTHCMILRPESFIQAVESVPSLALALIQVLAGRLSDADRKVARYAPDPLTGLMGRRAFMDQYRRLAAGARRRKSGALLVVLDIVGLRTANDRFGYPVGDEMLKTVADALVASTRGTDLVARHGGDEFAVMLVDGEQAHAEHVVDRVRAKVNELGRRRGLPGDITCAIGVAFAPVPADAPDDLFREADADMHRRRAG